MADAPRGLVLVVEDERAISDLLRLYIAREGFGVHVASDGRSALTAARTLHPVAIVLDVGLPEVDGTEVCRQLRAEGNWVPILFCTARDDEVDRVLGLELGADDYIAKPVQPRVLLARVKALLRRLPSTPGAEAAQGDQLVFGQFHISQSTRTAALADHPIDLTTAEFDLLWLLAQHAGAVLSRDDLLQELRGIGFDGLDRSIDARISRLRKKLGDDPDNPTRIKTVRGKGYLFSKHDWN